MSVRVIWSAKANIKSVKTNIISSSHKLYQVLQDQLRSRAWLLEDQIIHLNLQNSNLFKPHSHQSRLEAIKFMKLMKKQILQSFKRSVKNQIQLNKKKLKIIHALQLKANLQWRIKYSWFLTSIRNR